MHVRQRTRSPGVPQLIHRVRLQVDLAKQSPPRVSVVVGTIQRLLEATVFASLRRRSALHRLKLLERRVDSFVRREWSSPIPFEREQPLRKAVRVILAD